MLLVHLVGASINQLLWQPLELCFSVKGMVSGNDDLHDIRVCGLKVGVQAN
jgi:hypothetical protein